MSGQLTIKAECPHCGIKDIAMTILWIEDKDKDTTGVIDTFASCGHCKRCVLAVWTIRPDENVGSISDIIGKEDNFVRQHLDIFPSLERKGAPPDTDEEAAEFFAQGENCLPNSPDAAAMTFRKAVEIAIGKLLLEEGYELSEEKKIPLYEKIKIAHEKRRINDSMRDWAENIRKLGNKGAHAKRFSEEDAIEMKDFTEVLFQYLYTLPEKMRKQQEKHKSKND